ncbi:FAD-binding oxidoreductase [Roseibium limicola]|uniref:Flavodoxin reductase n=1 Tax=Roseibium limicola TaxID=2816037 RepID=A0A939J9F9_9HYPH|nr:FAD-binding oxidoreductase [Roseibium limicola]MBO0345353.1 flavodoxin reductase [Roseibium limicola]
MQKTTLLSVEAVTHDVRRFKFRRPGGFGYQPGDATELALDIENWRDEKRPFTMTSLPDDEEIEFTIKGYPEHDGVTTRLHALQPGDTVLIDEPFETFRYKGKGVFIAGGAGLTPFLAILRDLRAKGELQGNQLIFANKEEKDIICADELAAMEGLDLEHVLSEEDKGGYRHGQIDVALLKDLVPDFDRRFYLCGPPPMQKAIQEDLQELGVDADSVSLSD